MRGWFRSRKLECTDTRPPLAEAITMSAWNLTLKQWAGMTDFERAECRRNITSAPRFEVLV